MIIYLLILLFFPQNIIAELCPGSPEFLLSSSNKCFKLYQGKYGYENIFQSCTKNKGILSGFITNYETHVFNQLIKNYFNDLKEEYVDRGFTCYSKKGLCNMNRNESENVVNKIEFLTEKFPCRGVMSIKNLTLHCLDMSSENNIIYACQKDPLYIKNCSNNIGYEKYIDGNCYRLLEEIDFTKKTAEEMCKDKSGSLPIITNYFENLVIEELLTKTKSDFWLDFSCLTKNTSSCKWSTGEELKYNNRKNLNLRNYNLCGYINSLGVWGADHCDMRKKVICQVVN